MSAVSDPGKEASVRKGPKAFAGEAMPPAKTRTRFPEGTPVTFGKLSQAEAAAKGRTTQRMNAAKRKAEAAQSKRAFFESEKATAKLRLELAKMVVGELPDRDEVAMFAGAVVLQICGKILTGDIKVDEKNAGAMLKIAHDVMRLGDELPTAIKGAVSHAEMSHAEKVEAAKALLAKARQHLVSRLESS
jgi:hypothetical protein